MHVTPGTKPPSCRPTGAGNEALVYKLAETEAEKARIYDLRESIWRQHFPYLLNGANGGHPAKDAFDDRSWLFYCSDGAEVVGSCRCSPMLDGQWEISASLPPHIRLDFDPRTTVQVEKVYVHDAYRNSSLHEYLFYHFSAWLLSHTAYTRYFAVCRAELVRLYRRLGAQLVSPEGLLLHGRAAHKYYLIEGGIADVNAIAKQSHAL